MNLKNNIQVQLHKCFQKQEENQNMDLLLMLIKGLFIHGNPLAWLKNLVYGTQPFQTEDLNTAFSIEASNFDILDGNGYQTGMVDDRSEGTCSSTYDTSCLIPPFQDSGMAKEDRISRVDLPAKEQTFEGQLMSATSQYLVRIEKDKAHLRDNNDTDVGENSIISDILSMEFDNWEDDSLTSPHNVAKVLLGEKDRINGFPKDISSSRKLQNNGQSRFSFARQGESSRESCHMSNSCSSNGQLHDTWPTDKDALDDTNGYDNVKRPSNDRASCDREEYQVITNRTALPLLPGSAVAPPSVSRSQFSAPPGFSLPTRTPPVPPPGFFPQSRVDRPYEPTTITTVFSNGIKDHDDSVSSQNTFPNSYSLLHQTLGSNSSNDLEFIDPAIMAVGRGKLPVGQIQRGSAGPDSVFSGPRQDMSDSSFSQSFLGLRSPFSQQVSPIDYDARLQMLKQKSVYANSNLTSPRQPFTFQDQFGDAFTSYLSRQNDVMIPSMMREQSQMSLDNAFSQMSFQQPINSTFRSSSAGVNGWDSWNRMNSALESGLGERRMEASLVEIANKERMGLLDPKSGLSKLFPTYGESMFHVPSSENYYSRPFEM
ncbi:hypothetical protein KI387_003646 [Taxus chinensis]|uniref:CCR4-NOT transcription complex subunit 4 n=1 Tax=Taxus chinensis TaxID=29808 RepID=A0AA38GY23_TAXCH|nr:hypothetical protein KI387_003646 [Taxus chinensis]